MTRSLFESILLHALLLLLLFLIPFTEQPPQKDYIEVALLKNPQPKPETKRAPVAPAKKDNVQVAQKKAPEMTQPESPQDKPAAQMQEDAPQKPLPTKNVVQKKPDKKLTEQPIPAADEDQKDQANQQAAAPLEEEAQPSVGQPDSKSNDISGPIADRTVLHDVKPKYPAWAMEQGIEADVKVRFWVDPSGIVRKVRVIQRSAYPELDILAKQAARQWIFDKLDANLPQEEQWGERMIRYRLE